MNKNVLLALIIWSLDRDMFEGMSFIRNFSLFLKDAKGCKKIYTDPTDTLLYCPKVLNMSDIEFFTDYVLSYAKTRVISGIEDYGKFNKSILRYNNN